MTHLISRMQAFFLWRLRKSQQFDGPLLGPAEVLHESPDYEVSGNDPQFELVVQNTHGDIVSSATLAKKIKGRYGKKRQ